MKKRIILCVVTILVLLPVALAPSCQPQAAPAPTLNTLSPVCRGQGVEQAAPYTGEPPHPVVSLDFNGNEHPWMKKIPRDWCPASLDHVELVLVVGEEKEKLVQTCKYEGGPDVKRYRYSVEVELRGAKSGEIVSRTTIFGTMPRPCGRVEEVPLTRLEGARVSFSQLQRWLERYIMDVEEVATADTPAILTLAAVVPSWSDIESLTDLGHRTHRINIAFTSTDTEQCTLDEAGSIGDSLLGPYGFDYNSLLIPAIDTLRTLEGGFADCAFIWAKHPWQPLQDGDYRFLSLSADARVLASDSWDNVEPAVIPANTYGNQPEDVMTFGMYW